jgi:phospholipid/cholesterol/gamma-HCH transport system substrate-binding protein
MLKISNETKVGVLTALGIVLLIFGFNILKGRNPFAVKRVVYAVYDNVNGLKTSNPVMINGLTVGKVLDVTLLDPMANRMLVSLELNKDLQIPRNSVAKITAELLGSRRVELMLGDESELLRDKDTLYTDADESMKEALMDQLSPIVRKLELALGTVDTVLHTLNSLLDTTTRSNLQNAVANLSGTMNQMNQAATSLNGLLAKQGALQQTIGNLESLTGNLEQNNGKIDNILTNVDQLSSNLAKSDLNQAVSNLNTSLTQLSDILQKANSKEGSLGLLINDKQAYQNLDNSLGNLNKLLEDLRLNPWRYIHLSVFGKKNKVVSLPSDSIQ